MEWIKIKVGHCFYEYKDFTDSEFRAWIKIMSLVAIMEKVPSDTIILQHIRRNTLQSLKNKLSTHATTLPDIIIKVLEDVEYTKSLKAKNASKIAEWRRKHKESNQLPKPVTLPVTLPDNEDKITNKEDNITVTPTFSFEDFFELYPKKVGMSMALITFRATVKTEQDFKDLKLALKNYIASEEYKKGFIKNCDNWIEDWRGWVRMAPKSQVNRKPDPIPVKPKDVFKGGAKEDIEKIFKK